MLDLTKIKTAFGLLDEETQKALRSHKGGVQMYSSFGWIPSSEPSWLDYVVYRAKPEPRVIKAEYGVGRVWSGEPPTISEASFCTEYWRTMTGEIVVGDDGWPVSITLTRETEQC